MDQTTANTQSDTLATADVSDQSQQPQEQQVDFQSLIPEDYKEEKSLQNFSNMNDFVKSYLHSQKLVGADKIPVPNKMATDEDWNAVYERLGRPETPDGYKYELPKETKLEESTLSRLISRNEFPLPLNLSNGNVLRWYRDEIEDWLHDPRRIRV